MGTMGGNLLQRTRCVYFRDTGFACNKRVPGSGCPAIHGENRNLAVLGVSADCIATPPVGPRGGAGRARRVVELRAPERAARARIPVADCYRPPGDTPQHRDRAAARRADRARSSFPQARPRAARAYVKVRDRASFEFALVSAAVGLAIEDGTIRDARVALGGVGTKPWRHAAGGGGAARPAGDRRNLPRPPRRAPPEGAQPASQNAFKLKLMPRGVLRALQTAAA